MYTLQRSCRAVLVASITLLPVFSVAGQAQDTTQANVVATVKPIITVGGLLFKDLNANGKLDPYEDWRRPAVERAMDLISQMTLAEKVRLLQATTYADSNVQSYVTAGIRYLVVRDSLSAHDEAVRNNTWQTAAEGTRLGIPIVFIANPRDNIASALVYQQVEATGNWPGTLGLAASRDMQLIYDFSNMCRQLWVSQGIRKMYGYQVEVASEPRWNRNETTFGEGPWLNADIATQLVRGWQGTQLGPNSVALTVKHFPGDGAVWNGLDPHNSYGQWAAYPTPGSLFDYQIVPFQAAVDAGVSAVMSYYSNQINAKDGVQLPSWWWQSSTQQFEQVGAAFNKTLITNLLKDTMGFSGYINTDSGPLAGMDWGVDNLTLPQRYAKEIQAGVSISSEPPDLPPTASGLLAAVQAGLVQETDIDNALIPVLREIFQLGLFEDPYTDPDEAQTIANNPVTAARALDANHEAIVLLRNDTNVLPLIGTKKVYAQVFDGNNSSTETDSLRALLAQDSQLTLTSLSSADVAIVWLRPTVYQRPQHDYNDISLNTNTGIDLAAVQAIEATKPTILVINMINPFVINPVEPQAAAFLATYDVNATALLDVVRGRFNPIAKLPMTIPANQAAVDNNAPDVPGYLENFNYAYTNSVNDTYVFGFGLSYKNN
jgi:beta-glucosidase